MGRSSLGFAEKLVNRGTKAIHNSLEASVKVALIMILQYMCTRKTVLPSLIYIYIYIYDEKPRQSTVVVTKCFQSSHDVYMK